MPTDRRKDNPVMAAEVAREARSLGRELEAGQAEKLAAYLELLMLWNRKMNLVGPHDWQTVISTLVVDSWNLADFLESLKLPENPLTLDFGAGAGLPGIPLRVFGEGGEYHLVEIREKRTLFMEVALSRLKLPRTFVKRSRVENLPENLRRADLILSRAFMPWPEFLDLASGFLAPGGTIVVLSNDPPPAADAKPGFSLTGSKAYAAAGGTRYFWSFTPEAISR